jgi:nucleoside-diphosphate-sugar epimerase
MRIVVVGGSGNVGTRLLRALAEDQQVTEIVGVARRRPGGGPEPAADRVTWRPADVVADDLTGTFRGADAVVHLAWRMQPSHQPDLLWRTNVEGSVRVFDAVAAAGVPALVYASSIGAYSARPDDDRPVDEDWPTHGIATSGYSREKAYVERVLDAFELANPRVRVVRLRPALIFQREAGSEIHRYFVGRLVPGSVLGAVLGRDLPVLPAPPGLRLQALHAADAAEAYRLAATTDARGPFNLAADPVLDHGRLAGLLGGRPLDVPGPVVRGLAAATWALRLQPTSAGWVDMAMRCPLLDPGRARRELGWQPRHDAVSTLRELLDGLRTGAGAPSPPLHPRS